MALCTGSEWLTPHVTAELFDERSTLGSACLVSADTITGTGPSADTAFGLRGVVYA